MRAILAVTTCLALLAGCTGGAQPTPQVVYVYVTPEPATPEPATATVAPATQVATSEPTTAPTATNAAITFSGKGETNTPPQQLAAGAYLVEWSVKGDSGCYWSGHLWDTAGTYGETLGRRDGGPASGTNYIYDVPAGTFYVEPISQCASWRVVLTPQ